MMPTNDLLNNQLIFTNLNNSSTIPSNSANSISSPTPVIGDSPLDALRDQIFYQLVRFGIINEEGQIIKECSHPSSIEKEGIQMLSNTLSQEIKTYTFVRERTEKFIQKMKDSKFTFDPEQESLKAFLALPFLSKDNHEIAYSLQVKDLLKHLIDENKHLCERSGLESHSEDRIELVSSSAQACLIHTHWTTRFLENITGVDIKHLVPEERLAQIEKENPQNTIAIKYTSTLMNFEQMSELSREVVHQIALAIWGNNEALFAFDRTNFRLWKYFELFIQHTAFEEYSRNLQDNYDTVSLKQNSFRLDLTFMGTDNKQSPDALSIPLNPFLYDHPQPIHIIPSYSAQSVVDLYIGYLQPKLTFQDFIQESEQLPQLVSFIEVLFFLRLNTSVPSSSNLQVYLTRNGRDLAIECVNNFSYLKACDLKNSLEFLQTANPEFDSLGIQLFESLKPLEVFSDAVQTPVQRHWSRFNVSSEDLIKQADNLWKHPSKLLKKLGYYLCLSSHFIDKNEMTTQFLISKFPYILPLINDHEESTWLVRSFENAIFETHLKRGGRVLLQNPHLLKILSSKDLQSKEIKELCLLAWSETDCIKLETEAIQLYHQMPSSKKKDSKKKQELKNRLTSFFLNFLAKIHENQLVVSPKDLSDILIEISPRTIPANRQHFIHNLSIRCLMQTMETKTNQDFIDLQTKLSRHLLPQDHIIFLKKLIQSCSFTEAIQYFSQIHLDEWTPNEKEELLTLLVDLLEHITSDNLLQRILQFLSGSTPLLFKDIPQKRFSFLMKVLPYSSSRGLEIFPLFFPFLNESLPSEEMVIMTSYLQEFLSNNARTSKPFRELLIQSLPIIIYHLDQKKCTELWLNFLDVMQQHSIPLNNSEVSVKAVISLAEKTLDVVPSLLRLHHRLSYLKFFNESPLYFAVAQYNLYCRLISSLLHQNHFQEATLWIERVLHLYRSENLQTSLSHLLSIWFTIMVQAKEFTRLESLLKWPNLLQIIHAQDICFYWRSIAEQKKNSSISQAAQVYLDQQEIFRTDLDSQFFEMITKLALELVQEHIEISLKLFSTYCYHYNSSWNNLFDPIIASGSKSLKLLAWEAWTQQQAILAKEDFSSSSLIGLRLIKSIVIDNSSNALDFLKKRQTLLEYPAFKEESAQKRVLLTLLFSALKHIKNMPKKWGIEIELCKIRQQMNSFPENFDFTFLEEFTDLDLIQRYPLPVIDGTLIKAFCESEDITVCSEGISRAFNFFAMTFPLLPHTHIAQETFIDIIQVMIREPSSELIRNDTLTLFGMLGSIPSFKSIDIVPILKIYEEHLEKEDIAMAALILIMSYWAIHEKKNTIAENQASETTIKEHFGTNTEHLSKIAPKVCLYGLQVESFENQKVVYRFLMSSKKLLPMDQWNLLITKTIFACLKSAVRLENASNLLIAVKFFLDHFEIVSKVKSTYSDSVIYVFENLFHLIDLDCNRKDFLHIFIHVLNMISGRKEPFTLIKEGLDRPFSASSEEDILQDWQLICEHCSNPPNKEEYYSTLLFAMRTLSLKKTSVPTNRYKLLFLHNLMSIFNNDDSQITLDNLKIEDMSRLFSDCLFSKIAYHTPEFFHLHMEKCKVLFNQTNTHKRISNLPITYRNPLLLFGDPLPFKDFAPIVLQQPFTILVDIMFSMGIMESAHYLFERLTVLFQNAPTHQLYQLYYALFKNIIVKTIDCSFYQVVKDKNLILSYSSPNKYLYRYLLDMVFQFSIRVDHQHRDNYIELLQIICAFYASQKTKLHLQKKEIKTAYYIIARDLKIFFQSLIRENILTSNDLFRYALLGTLIHIISFALEELKDDQNLQTSLKDLDLFEFFTEGNVDEKNTVLKIGVLTDWIHLFEIQKNSTLKNYAKELNKRAIEAGFKTNRRK